MAGSPVRPVRAKRPTTKQTRVLLAGLMGPVRGGYANFCILRNDDTGCEFGTSRKVVQACQRAGWLDAEGRTTSAGSAVIADDVIPAAAAVAGEVDTAGRPEIPDPFPARAPATGA